MSTLDFDYGDLRPRPVEFAANDLVVTLADGAGQGEFRDHPMGIHWPDLDEDLGIAGMFKEVARRAQPG
jgi:hypothetical protein